jgi:hypothetical protein
VAVISIVVGIIGAVLLIIGIAFLLYGTVGAFTGLTLFGATLIGGIVLTVFSIVLLTTASGLWHLELWALVLSLVVIGVLLLYYGVSGQFVSLSGIFFLVIFVYLIAVHREFV